jgi:hypothetical protein
LIIDRTKKKIESIKPPKRTKQFFEKTLREISPTFLTVSKAHKSRSSSTTLKETQKNRIEPAKEHNVREDEITSHSALKKMSDFRVRLPL